ncbi:MAG: thermonuclease family protein [Deltaproteobacteria bacterium]|jgi:micrococcal nuclease|nr:thermonuclease family protein [Deltaproteobacteria bacterium]
MNIAFVFFNLVFLTLAATVSLAEAQAAVPPARALVNSAKESVLDVTFVRCHDADTCHFKKNNGETLKVRFAGVDAPEKKKPYSKEATQYIVSKLTDQKVTLRCVGQSFDRRVCSVFIGQLDVAEDLVRAGFAWDAPKHSKGRYRSLEDEARLAKRGLWAQVNVQSPVCQRMKTKGAKRNCRTNPLYRE